MSKEEIKLNDENEFWVLKNAIADKIYNLNEVIHRTKDKNNEYWVKQVDTLIDIRDRLKYKKTYHLLPGDTNKI